ncbi:MAG: PAS domain S-box protein, partial [Deltaproteobacteria bacterium]|nr:PAS domain S-box protein [Deltaproteobacteria bacterium]
MEPKQITEQLVQFFFQHPIKESITSSFNYLSDLLEIEGIAALVHLEQDDVYILISSNQFRNSRGVVIKPPVSFPINEKTKIVTKAKKVKVLAQMAEMDIEAEKASASYLTRNFPSSNNELILLLFGETQSLQKINLHFLTRLYTVLMRDSFYLRALNERTKRIKRSSLKNIEKSKTIKTYREFFESSSDGIIIVNEDNKILYMNHAGESITGYSSEGLKMANFKKIVAKNHKEFIKQGFKNIPEQFNLNILTTSREIVCLGVNKSQLLAKSGLTVLIFRDITETREMQERLSSTSDLLIRLVDNSVIAIIAAHLGGNIILFNPAAKKLFGYSPASVIDKMPLENLFTNSKTLEKINNMMVDVKIGGENRIDLSRESVLSSDDKEVPVNMSAFVISGEYDQNDNVVFFLSDLREQIKMEKQIDEYKEKLAEKEKLALISTLAGTTAHELNQPLMSIRGYSELLKKPDLPKEKLEKAVNHIINESDRMAK